MSDFVWVQGRDLQPGDVIIGEYDSHNGRVKMADPEWSPEVIGIREIDADQRHVADAWRHCRIAWLATDLLPHGLLEAIYNERWYAIEVDP